MHGKPNVAVWMGVAFAVSVACAAIEIALFGAGEHGTVVALRATARISFLLFWAAYAGGALVTLFGSRFEAVRRRGRALGLAFAAAHMPHVALVGWLCWIGATPSAEVFAIFGVAVLCLVLLVLCSIARVRRALGPAGWWWLQFVGMNYIAFAFAKDFVKLHHYDDVEFVLAYLPFGILSALGPALVFAALALRAGRAGAPMLLHLLPRRRHDPEAVWRPRRSE